MLTQNLRTTAVLQVTQTPAVSSHTLWKSSLLTHFKSVVFGCSYLSFFFSWLSFANNCGWEKKRSPGSKPPEFKPTNDLRQKNHGLPSSPKFPPVHRAWYLINSPLMTGQQLTKGLKCIKTPWRSPWMPLWYEDYILCLLTNRSKEKLYTSWHVMFLFQILNFPLFMILKVPETVGHSYQWSGCSPIVNVSDWAFLIFHSCS